MYLRACGSFKSAKHKKWVRKSQICKLSQLEKVGKSNKLLKSAKFADLQFAELICRQPTFGFKKLLVLGKLGRSMAKKVPVLLIRSKNKKLNNKNQIRG